MSELAVVGLAKSYPGRPPVAALVGVDLYVPSGALAAVLGPSGCGKTTLLRVVAGFERADGGTVRIGGDTVDGPGGRHVPPERRHVGVVPQEGALFPHLDVAGNVAFGLRGRPAAERRRRVGEVLELVGLPGCERRRPHQLSGGQQQRVALARALAPRPAVVLLDEPFAALDADLRSSVRAEVVAALRAAGATAVLVTHDQAEALSLTDEVAVMRQGRIVQAGPPAELYRHPVDPDVARATGLAVVLGATVADRVASCGLGRLALADPVPAGPAQVVLRPEQVAVLGQAGQGGVAATVARVDYHGHDATVHAVLGDGTPVVARVQGAATPGVGATVHLVVTGTVLAFPTSA